MKNQKFLKDRIFDEYLRFHNINQHIFSHQS